jgi:hypothetical protein
MHPSEHFCCQNSSCPDAGQRGRGNLSFRGWSGKGKRIRMIYCRTCQAHCSERKGTVLEEARLPDAKALAVLRHIQEGCGTRATSRLVQVDKNTVTRYLALAGTHADKLHQELVAFFPEHHAASYFIGYTYNFCWCVRTLRVQGAEGRYEHRTPALAAGLADHVRSLQEWITYPARPG